MGHIQINVPVLMTELVRDYDQLRRLDEINRLHACIDGKAGHACWPAALSGNVGHFSRQHVVVGFLHLLDRPGLEDRVAEIRNPISRLPAGPVGHIRAALFGHHRARPARRREVVVTGGAVRDPGGVRVRTEVAYGYRGGFLRKSKAEAAQEHRQAEACESHVLSSLSYEIKSGVPFTLPAWPQSRRPPTRYRDAARRRRSLQA